MLFRLISIARYVLNLQVIVFEGQYMKFTLNMLLTFHTVIPGPAVILELLASTMIDCYHGYHVCPRMFFGDDVAKITSRKLYVCLMKCNAM